MESLLKKATKSADAAEVYSITSEEVPVAFEANKLKLLETKRTTGRALRIIRRGRIGLAASTVTTDSGEDDLVRMAVESSEIGDAAKFDFPGKSGSPDDAALPAPQIYDPSVVEIKADELVDIGKNMISIITAYDPEIRCDINLSRYIEEVSIVNSNGGGGSYRKTGLFCGLAATAIDGNVILMGYRGIGSCRSGLDFRALAEDILET